MRPTEEEQYYEHWLNERKQQADAAERARVEAYNQAMEEQRRQDEYRRQQEERDAASSSSYSSDYSSGYSGGYSGGGYSGGYGGGGSVYVPGWIITLVLLGFILAICMMIWGFSDGIAHFFGIFKFVWGIVKFIWGIVKWIFSIIVAAFKMNVFFGIMVVVGILALLNMIFGN